MARRQRARQPVRRCLGPLRIARLHQVDIEVVRLDMVGVAAQHGFDQPQLRGVVAMAHVYAEGICPGLVQGADLLCRVGGRPERGQHPRPPGGGALGTRRQIAALSPAGIAEPHGHQRNLCWIVEIRITDAHPFSQTDATGVIPRHAAFMRQTPWRLPRDDDLRRGRNRHNRARGIRQVRLAHPAGQDVPSQPVDLVGRIVTSCHRQDAQLVCCPSKPTGKPPGSEASGMT